MAVLSLDSITALLGVVGGLSVVVLSYSLQLGQSGVGWAILIGSLGYLVHTQFNLQSDQGFSGFKASQGVFLVSILCAILIGNTTSYNRPSIYYLLFGVAGGALAWGTTATLRQRERRHLFIVTEAVVLALVYRTLRFWQWPLIPGNDINFHVQVAQFLANNGEMPATAGKYTTANIFHQYLSSGFQLGIEPKTNVYLLVVVPFSVSVISGLYLVTCRLSTSRAGVYTAILASSSSMIVVRGTTSITPSALVLCLTPFAIFGYTLRDQHREIGDTMLIVIVSVSLFTHQLSSLILTIFLSCMVFGRLLIQRVEGKVLDSVIQIVFLAILLVISWMVTQVGDSSLLATAVIRTVGTLTSLGASDGGYAASLNQWGVLSNLLYLGGYYLILLLGVFGSLQWLHPESQTPNRVGLLTGMVAVFVLVYPATLLGLDKFLIPHRILVFLVFGLIIAGGEGIDRLRGLPYGQLSVAILVGIVVTASLTAPFIIRGDTVYGGERVEGIQLTDQDVYAVERATQIADGQKVYVDHRMLVRSLRVGISSVDGQLLNYPTSGGRYEEGSIIVDRGVRAGTSGTFGSTSSQVVQPSACENKQLVMSLGDIQLYQLTEECVYPQ